MFLFFSIHLFVSLAVIIQVGTVNAQTECAFLLDDNFNAFIFDTIIEKYGLASLFGEMKRIQKHINFSIPLLLNAPLFFFSQSAQRDLSQIAQRKWFEPCRTFHLGIFSSQFDTHAHTLLKINIVKLSECVLYEETNKK